MLCPYSPALVKSGRAALCLAAGSPVIIGLCGQANPATMALLD
jgi:hypothetical protein